MEFTVISHAGLSVESGDVSLLMDPWLIGSCYWRSWWNLPEPSPELVESLAPTHIYLTHLHWDHFHGPSLRRFPKDTQMLVPECHTDRMVRDLEYLGFTNIRELRHGEAVDLGGLTVEPHIFGQLNDSALVITDGTTTLLNANDCKIFGYPLDHLTKRHPNIDFVFRSHSNASAYPYCVDDFESFNPGLRSKQSYQHEFASFALHVGARYAIPFASNHCYLHKDTVAYNDMAVSPNDVARFFEPLTEHYGGRTECVIMPPGSKWARESGFDVRPFDYDNRHEYIEKLAVERREKLEARYSDDAAATLDYGTVEGYFTDLMSKLPRSLAAKLPTIDTHVQAGDKTIDRVVLDFPNRAIRRVSLDAQPGAQAILYCDAAVLNDCAAYHMFSVWSASKRLRFTVDRSAGGDLTQILRFLRILDLYELDYLPLRKIMSPRSLKARAPRWREALQLAEVGWRVKVRRSGRLDVVDYFDVDGERVPALV